jgi:hypothetical protein
MIQTNNEKAAKLIVERLGLEQASCALCVYGQMGAGNNQFRATCNHPIALAIKAGIASGMRYKYPVIPVFRVESNDQVKVEGEEDTKNSSALTREEVLPTVIGLEFGVNNGFFRWPTEFDPLYLLMCIFYANKSDAEKPIVN